MKRQTILLVFTIWQCFIVNLYSNVDSIKAIELYQLAEINHEKDSDYLKYANLAYPELKKYGIWNLYLETLRGLSSYYFNESDFQQADYFANLLNKELTTISAISLRDKYSTLLSLTIYHYRKANYELAIKLSEEAVALVPKEKRDSFDIARAYINLGAICTTKGDEFKAFKYYQEALKAYKDDKEADATIISALYNNISIFYINQKNFLVARDYLHKAVKLVKAMPTSERNVRALMKYYKNLGECYAKLRMIDSSAIVLQNILDTPDLPINFYANANKGIGILYLQNGLANKALFTLEIALEQYYTAFSDKHPDIAATYLNIGDVYLDLGYDSLALTNYQLAINNLVIDFNELNDCDINPAIDDDISSDADLIKILHKKALVQQVINNPENALNTIDLAAQLITRLRTAFQSTNSKVFLNENTRQILETGINISLELFEKTKNVTYLTKVFGFSDNYKATILQESILKLEVLEKLAIPDSIRYTLSSLKNNISFYKRKIEEARGNDKAQLESAKFDLEQELQKIQEQIKIEYPVYADLLDVPDYLKWRYLLDYNRRNS